MALWLCRRSERATRDSRVVEGPLWEEFFLASMADEMTAALATVSDFLRATTRLRLRVSSSIPSLGKATEGEGEGTAMPDPGF